MSMWIACGEGSGITSQYRRHCGVHGFIASTAGTRTCRNGVHTFARFKAGKNL